MMTARKNKGDYTDQRWKPSTTQHTYEFADIPAIVYHGTDAKGRQWAMGYHGRAGKPDFYNSFRTIESMNAHIKGWLSGLRQHKQRQESERAERKEFKHGLRPGMILHGSWGYDQTNCEYFKVIEVKGKSVIVVEIGHKTVEGSQGFMSEQVAPDPDNVIGKPIKKLVLPGNRLSFDHFSLSLCGADSEYYSSWYA